MTVWTVPARIVRVIDGDTIVADLDLGWDTWRVNQRVRLLGCDCPEMNTIEGKLARQFVVDLLSIGSEVAIESHSLDSFGRVLGRVTWSVDGLTRRDLTIELLDAGHAVSR